MKEILVRSSPEIIQFSSQTLNNVAKLSDWTEAQNPGGLSFKLMTLMSINLDECFANLNDLNTQF